MLSGRLTSVFLHVLLFVAYPQEITAMISIEGERIPFDVPVETAGDFNGVERWLLKVRAEAEEG
jgi:hypothetical protein